MVFSKSCSSFLRLCLIIVSFIAFQCNADGGQTSTLVVNAAHGRPMPDTLFGVFYEEINHAGAGGLWSELVNNRGFEAGGKKMPSNFAPWTIVGTETTIHVETELSSCFERNKVALRMNVLCDNCPFDGVGISNPGYWGMNIVQGKKYKVVFYYSSTGPLDLTVSFRDGQGGGAILGSSHIIKPNKKGAKWKKIESIITASASSPNAGITLRTTKKGTIWLDQVSAMPQDTYKGHGFRSDLVEMVQKLKPAFLRFPGGCFVEGVTLRNAFRWKETVGPWEERAGHFNDIWKYWTDDGLGFYEGLLLAEDVNAAPIWVFNNGISHTDEIDTKDIQPFVQEALDGIEFARGPSSSKWGSLRASMGHPEPFVLKYVAIGNEDCGLKNYLGNYLVFHKEIRKYYPDILMISNCDASRKPLDHPADLYDYHIYPVDDVHMMFTNAEVFDHTPRNGPKAFVSEYALVGANIARHGTLIGGLSEAGFLIGLERNSDHVAMAAYAPLFVNANDRVWNPDAIVFSSNQVYGTPSYWVTYLFKESNGATYLNSTLQTTDPGTLAASAILVKDPQNKNTYLKIKIANMRKTQVDFKISIQGFASKNLKGSTKTVLTGNELDENSFAEPKKVAPQTSPLQNPGNEMNVIVKPTSLTILDMF